MENLPIKLRSRLTGNSLILLINNIGAAGLAFIISAVIGRTLGAEGLGKYSFIMAWASPMIMLADFGMGSLLTRDAAQDRESALPLLHTATRALVPIAGGMILFAWLTIPLLRASPTVTAGLILTAFLIVLDPWYGLYTALFRAFEQMWPILVINAGGFLLQLIVTLVLIHSTGLTGVISVLVGVNVLQLTVTWLWWRAYISRLRLTSAQSQEHSPNSGERWGEVKRLFRRAWPFALAAVLGALQMRLNFLLLEHLAGDVQVGLYSAATRFVEAGRMIPNAFFGALFPALASLAAQPDAMRRTFRRSALLLALFGAAFGLGLTVVGNLLIRLTYDPDGTKFAGAGYVLALLAWSLLPSLLRAVLTLYHYGLGREQFVNRVTLVALALQAVIGWILIGQWGAAGAALTVSIVEGGAVIWLWLGTGGRLIPDFSKG